MSSSLTCRFGKESLLLEVILGDSASSSMMMGMGLFLVCRWCTCLVALITLGAVGSFDVGAEIGLLVAPCLTLEGAALSTLGGVASVMVVYKALVCPAWASLSAALIGVIC